MLDFDLQEKEDQEYKTNSTVSFFSYLKYRRLFFLKNIVSSSGKKTLVTHNYGHGGSGYQSSWGSCQEAVRLIHQGHALIENDRLKIKQLLSRL